jgi:hypothetical protein
MITVVCAAREAVTRVLMLDGMHAVGWSRMRVSMNP